MIKQLRKVGNSTALLLDKPILELLGIKDRGKVQLTVTNGSLRRHTGRTRERRQRDDLRSASIG